MERLRALFEAFSEQRDLLHLLDKSLSARRRQDLYWRRERLRAARRLFGGDRALFQRRRRGWGAGGDRPHPHGL